MFLTTEMVIYLRRRLTFTFQGFGFYFEVKLSYFKSCYRWHSYIAWL